jgi:DinB superfamily
MNTQERQELIQQYVSGFDEVIETLQGMDEKMLRERAIPGKWTACEIIHHLADSETTSALRLRRLLVEESPLIQAYDQDAFADSLHYNDRELSPALEAFRSARATTAQLFPFMTDEDWRRSGTHSESGPYSAEDWLRIYAAHAHNHANQIRQLKEAMSLK